MCIKNEKKQHKYKDKTIEDWSHAQRDLQSSGCFYCTNNVHLECAATSPGATIRTYTHSFQTTVYVSLEVMNMHTRTLTTAGIITSP